MDGYLWVYDRSEKEFRHQQPVNTEVRKHYYSVDLPDGTRDPSPELTLARIEGKAKPVFDAMIAGRTLSPGEREAAIEFLAVLPCRITRFERETNEVVTELAKRYVREKLTDGRSRADLSVQEEELLEFVEGDELQVLAPRNFTLERMGKEAMALASQIQSWTWIVAHAPARSAFVTCDAPFAFLDSEIVVPFRTGTIEIHAVVPLAPTAALLFSRAPSPMSDVMTGSESVRRLNLLILRETETYAIARDERQLRSLVRATRLAKDGAATRMEVEFPPEDVPLRSAKAPRIRIKRHRQR